MYKMKEVCQMTGLTEKAIRIYMEQKLVEPKVEEGVHRKSYFFSDKDVERLRDISTLRSAGFSISEIKQMQEKPEDLSMLIEERKEMLEGEILQKLSIQEALKNLTIVEHSDVSKLADAIEPRSTRAKETLKKKMSRKARWTVLIMLLIVIFGWIRLISGKRGVWIGISAIAFVSGIIAAVSSVRYLFYHRKTQKLSQRAVGKITAVVENEKIEEYIGIRERSTSKEFLAYLVFGMFGEGVWNMLRPDAWYPVISYQSEDGNFHTATTRFGAFSSSWKIGETVALTWEDGNENLVHICSENVYLKKVYSYVWIALSLFVLFGVGIWTLFGKQKAVNVSERLRYPVIAERVEIKIDGNQYVLNDEEIEVLKTWLDEAEIKSVERYIFWDKEGMINISFYQGDELIERLVVNDVYYVYAMNGMKYWIGPLNHIELRGVDLGDSLYTTVFLGNLKQKVLERYAIEEISACISEIEDLSDLKEALEVTQYFEGAISIESGYQFIFTEKGYAAYFARQPEEYETGLIEVYIAEGEFQRAVLRSFYYNESEDAYVETYRKEW